LAECLDAGISVVSGNYRLIDTAPFPAAMMDGARTIQFIRFHAKKFNIDPARIALSGSSAGANMSIWIAMKDDLAKGNSKDPIARQSTRVSCVVSMAGQTSNDPNFILTNIGGSRDNLHPSTLGFYGIESRDQLWSPAIKKKAYEASAINFATQDDPPLFLAYSGNLTPTPLPADTPEGARIHHPRFGELLKEKYDQLGGECHFYHKAVQAKPEARIDFLKKHLHR
jgi:acetyl esterase/lipase